VFPLAKLSVVLHRLTLATWTQSEMILITEESKAVMFSGVKLQMALTTNFAKVNGTLEKKKYPNKGLFTCESDFALG
jgi:hypothetical protein